MVRKDPQSWLYPEIECNQHGFLDVGDGHSLYYEESGNPKGKPVVFVHGGPGSGTSPKQRRFFDPRLYRIILFDQRGAGKSLPHACLDGNTTWNLVEDMEKLRKHLGIETWQVFGGSWGSTLSLAYSVTHPKRVKELVLRGIFLIRKKEIDWFYQGGTSEMFPDAWEKYLAAIPPAEHSDLVAAYYKRLTSEDQAVRLAAAKAWSIWEGTTSNLYTNVQKAEDEFGQDKFAEAFARIECHYFTNKGFFEKDGWLLDQAHILKDIPTVIVQGRYDVVCPAVSAWDLQKKLPNADFIMVPDAGHSAFEPGISRALVAATDKFAKY
jgi:proline iminopeptidase